MKKTDFAAMFPEAWGASADAQYMQFPVPSSTTATGRASLDLGFPPSTMTPPESGGSYPFGADVNGGFRMCSTSARNYEAGVIPPYSQPYAQEIGGYPQGARVADATTLGAFWVSTADDNLTTPGASGASWQSLFANILPSQKWAYQAFIPTSGSVTSNTVTITVGGSGCLMLCIASSNIGGSGVQPVGCALSINLDGTQIAYDNTIESMSLSRTTVLAPGSHTITANYTAGSSSSSNWSSVGLSSSMLFMPLP